MTDPKRLSEQEQADLVAFLDGELGDAEARAVEAKINSDPALRAEAEALKRTWELLDYLPSQDPSPSFTHRTIERISGLQAKQCPTAKPAQRRWRGVALGLSWAAAVLLMAGLGFGLTTRILPREPTDEELLRDLRVIENKRIYEQVDDLDFLKQLDRPDLFGDDPDS